MHRSIVIACAAAATLVAAPAHAQGRTALHAAVEQHDDEQLRGLLAKPENLRLLEARDAQDRTALLLATALGHAVLAESLIRAGADVNAQDDRRDSAYLVAGAEGNLPILTLTLAHGADLRTTNRFGGTALIPAAERGHVQAVRLLIAAGVDVNHVNRLGWTALLEAIILSKGGLAHQDIVRPADCGRRRCQLSRPGRRHSADACRAARSSGNYTITACSRRPVNCCCALYSTVGAARPVVVRPGKA